MTESVSAFSERVKLLVLLRTKRRCDRCGFPMQNGHFHHRLPRRAGGSLDPALGTAANCLLLHPRCHDYVESHRTESLRKGMLLSAVADPATRPVKLWSGWVLLSPGGGATPTDEPSTIRPD